MGKPLDKLGPIPSRQQVTLEGFSLEEAEPLRDKVQEIDAILGYFERRTNNRRLPKRSDVVPTDLKPYLPTLAILEPVYDRQGMLKDVVIRLMGTNLADFYGEQTGKSIFAYGDREVSNRMWQVCHYCLEQRRPVTSNAETFSPERPYFSVRSLLIPLSEDGTHIDRIFGYMILTRKSI